VLARVDGRLVPVPVNINTVNALLNLTLKTEREMDLWLQKTQVPPAHGGAPRNSKEMALSRVGSALYKKVFEPYTLKQWAKDPAELAPSVTARIPVRNNFDNRYFSDRFQALPTGGYTAFFGSLLAHPNVTTLLDVDFFKVRPRLCASAKLFYTGPVDAYFAHAGLGKLEYRSIRFVRELYRNHGYWQPVSVVNYPQDEKACGFDDCSFTRIVEYKHYYGQTSPHTVTFREYSSDEGEPYYPVPSARNVELYAKFKALAEAERGVYFVGRLANYKYFNMDQAIDNALAIFEQTLCEVMPGSDACKAVRRGEHPAMWATKRADVPLDQRATAADADAAMMAGGARRAGGGLVGAGGAMDKAVETAWRSPSDD
jgi:UDP-galactopyranose mutase